MTHAYAFGIADVMGTTLKAFEVSVIANNIFNAEYSETNLVPNPKGNVLFGLSYVFK